jgi:hypothetical protein
MAKSRQVRSKLTIDVPASLKRRIKSFAGARGETASQVLARAAEKELGDFEFRNARIDQPQKPAPKSALIHTGSSRGERTASKLILPDR